MLETILLVIILNSGGAYFAVETPSMKECLDSRIKIIEQDPTMTMKTLCLPMVDDTAKIQEFLVVYMTMINQIKDRESEIDCDEKPNLNQFLNQLMETPKACSQDRDNPLLRN